MRRGSLSGCTTLDTNTTVLLIVMRSTRRTIQGSGDLLVCRTHKFIVGRIQVHQGNETRTPERDKVAMDPREYNNVTSLLLLSHHSHMSGKVPDRKFAPMSSELRIPS